MIELTDEEANITRQLISKAQIAGADAGAVVYLMNKLSGKEVPGQKLEQQPKEDKKEVNKK